MDGLQRQQQLGDDTGRAGHYVALPEIGQGLAIDFRDHQWHLKIIAEEEAVIDDQATGIGGHLSPLLGCRRACHEEGELHLTPVKLGRRFNTQGSAGKPHALQLPFLAHQGVESRHRKLPLFEQLQQGFSTERVDAQNGDIKVLAHYLLLMMW